MSEALLSIRDLTLALPTDAGEARILDGATLSVGPGEIMGLVGESGCGKSTIAKAAMGILAANARILAGEVRFMGENLLALDEHTLQRRIRGRGISFIPQDPFLSFNPVFTVGTQLMEIMRGHAAGGATRASRRAHLVQTLHAVRIPDPERALDRFAHEFSGGQRQRLMIAGALLLRPQLIIADEPTSALDVTTQQQILNLLRELARRYDVAMLFVTHDFGVVAALCDTVTVMYAGQTIERAATRVLIDSPLHPYTRRLIACHPDRGGALAGIQGIVPAATAMPAGCRFHPRCLNVMPQCSGRRPHVTWIESEQRGVQCYRYPAFPSQVAHAG